MQWRTQNTGPLLSLDSAPCGFGMLMVNFESTKSQEPTVKTDQNSDSDSPAVNESGLEPTAKSLEPTADPTTYEGNVIIDGQTFSAQQTHEELQRKNAESDSLRRRLHERDEEVTTLRSAQNEAERLSLEEKGEFKKLYEELQATHSGFRDRVQSVLTSAAVRSALSDRGVPVGLRKRLNISTEGLAVDLDSDTLEIQGDVAALADAYMVDLGDFTKPSSTPDSPGKAKAKPTQPTTEIKEHRRQDEPVAGSIKLADFGNVLGAALEKSGVLSSFSGANGRRKTPTA